MTITYNATLWIQVCATLYLLFVVSYTTPNSNPISMLAFRFVPLIISFGLTLSAFHVL